MADQVDFRILGHLEVTVEARQVEVPAAKHRVLLATLLLKANAVVSVDELTARLWGADTPRTARATLQTYVQRLRRTLGDDDRLVTTPSGYRISVAPEELDLGRFRAAVGRADGLIGTERAEVLHAALALWRDRPLVDVPSDLIQTEDVPLLDEERLDAAAKLFDVMLSLGRHDEIVSQLQAITTEHPFRERFCGQLMTALYRSGRQADSFAAYQRLRTELAEHLGVDPGREIQDLHQAILVDDPDLRAPKTQAAAPSVPRELPGDIGDFVGRDEIADRIRDVIVPNGGRAVPIALISGAPGIGKTALAVHVAHDVAARFPDGQLYADLRGHAPTPALGAGQVLARFLVALGVPGASVPSDHDALVNLYRTQCASRRLLILLDNAASAQQVRPLLPNAAGCGVLVTSRQELRGLTALQGARPFGPGVLTAEHAHRLLVGIIGAERVDREASASAELAVLCGYLPLALRIAAANLVATDRPIAEFVAELGSGDRLKSLAIDGDADAAVRSAFGLSYAGLDAEAASLFRLLGVVPGPTFTPEAAEALAGGEPGSVASGLDRLVTANLVSRDADRYRLHDLLRLYAAERCAEDPARDAARDRLLRWYAASAEAALDVDHPQRYDRSDPTGAKTFADGVTAGRWLHDERPNLVAAAMSAADDGPPEFTRRLSIALARYFEVWQEPTEWKSVTDTALPVAEKAEDLAWQAALWHSSGARALVYSDQETAIEHLELAGELYQRAGRLELRPSIYCQIAQACVHLGRRNAAIDNLEKAEKLLDPDSPDYADVLNEKGFVLLFLGDLDGVIRFSSDAIRINEIHGRRIDLIPDLINRAVARRFSGHYLDALVDARRALAVSEELDVGNIRAASMCCIAGIRIAMGDLDGTGEPLDRALRLATQTGEIYRQGHALLLMAHRERVLGRVVEAVEFYDRSLERARQVDSHILLAEALLGRAEVMLDTGDVAAARRDAMAGRRIAVDTELNIQECQSEIVLAAVCAAEGSPSHAEHVARARELCLRTGYVSPPTSVQLP